jgi:rubrerythrin
MSDAIRKILDGIESAIQAEVEGYHFYMMAARSTEDEKGRRTFENLAQDEADHASFLKVQYAALLKTGIIDPSVHLGSPPALEGESPIFSESLKARAKSVHYEMSAVSIGSQLELSAIRFYTELAAAAEDPDVKAFFEDLASWEQGHYDALTRQLEQLRGEHWDVNRFSPF